jgi:predicted AlkP superfamily pyrophosphatase or phosphodiesterase
MTRFVLLVLSFVLATGCAAPRLADTQRTAPSSTGSPLVVVLVVDQLRSEYFETYGSRFTGGFRRLMDEGAWFRNGAYPYLNTVTCAGHSTIGTGAFPYRHGMVLNAWWDREAGRSQPCTSDPTVKNIGYTGTPPGGDSPVHLLVPPIGQQLREKTGGRAVAISLKPRSTITLAGRGATAVLWFHDTAGWSTSTAFTPKPLDWIQQFITANPIETYRGKVWERMKPVTEYTGEDDAPGEATPSGWGRTFPHILGEPAAQFQMHWQRSPFADEYLGRLAAHAIDTLNLGRGTGTDFLSVSFSTLDLVGHQYGPKSHEVQDVLLRLDQTIGKLLDHLDARLGRDGYVLALGADHGVANIPEQTGGQRQPSAEIINTINTALTPFFGPGKYVAHAAYTDIYLAPGVFERLKASPEASRAVLDALRAMPGIAHAFRSDEISNPAVRESSDPIKRAAALSHYPPRSGDLIIVPTENWLLSSAATTHGTLYPYDQRVPVIFFGAGVPPGPRDGPATPADIAPTLAALAGAPFAATDGVALLKR